MCAQTALGCGGGWCPRVTDCRALSQPNCFTTLRYCGGRGLSRGAAIELVYFGGSDQMVKPADLDLHCTDCRIDKAGCLMNGTLKTWIKLVLVLVLQMPRTQRNKATVTLFSWAQSPL